MRSFTGLPLCWCNAWIMLPGHFCLWLSHYSITWQVSLTLKIKQELFTCQHMGTSLRQYGGHNAPSFKLCSNTLFAVMIKNVYTHKQFNVLQHMITVAYCANMKRPRRLWDNRETCNTATHDTVLCIPFLYIVVTKVKNEKKKNSVRNVSDFLS